MKKIKELKAFVLNIFFTRRCKYCQQVIDIREEICPDCKNQLNRIEGEICIYCGAEKSRCTCRNKRKYYTSICAPYYYDGAPKKAVAQLKFRDKPHIAELFAEDLADCFSKNYGELNFDVCTFVPVHKKDFKRRGYNQAQLLATELCKKIDLPCEELLEKKFITQPQHTLNEAMRSGNLLGAISLNEAYKGSIADMRILLCDDVKTTGATLDECAKTLLINGAAEVRCITLCTTSPKGKD